MRLEGADGSLGVVAAVQSCWGQLEINFFLMHVPLELFGSLVVEALKFWMVAGLGEKFDGGLIPGEKGILRAGLEEDWFDIARVVVQEAQNLFVA